MSITEIKSMTYVNFMTRAFRLDKRITRSSNNKSLTINDSIENIEIISVQPDSYNIKSAN